jgi:hypothetical protein
VDRLLRTKKKNLGFLIVLIITNGAHAQNASVPFYDAFTTFCSNTGATPDLVKAAVEAAPLSHLSGAPGSTTFPYPMTVTNWNVNWNGNNYTVASLTARSPYGPNQIMESNSCTITSRADDDASVAAIRKWVGVQPNPSSRPDSGITYYDYREDGSLRVATISDAAVKSAETAGKAWTMTVILQPGFVSVQLVHFRGPTVRN